MRTSIHPRPAAKFLVKYRNCGEDIWQIADEFDDYFEAARWAASLPEVRPEIAELRVVPRD